MSKKIFHEYSVEELLFDVGLYQKMELDLLTPKILHIPIEIDPDPANFFCLDAVKAEISDDLSKLQSVFFGSSTAKHPIYKYCPECAKDMPFTFGHQSALSMKLRGPVSDRNTQYLNVFSEPTVPEEIQNIDFKWKQGATQEIEQIVSSNLMAGKEYHYMTLHLNCSLNPEHKLGFHFLLKKVTPSIAAPAQFQLIKVGQYPSFADYKISEKKKYKKALKNLGFETEYTRAIGLFAQGIGIGSFVYLRRILEFLVQQTHSDSNLQIENFEQQRFGEKIKSLKEYLPKFLVDNSAIYGIVSAGIHELSEDDCLAYFPIILSGIEFILEQKHHLLEQQTLETETSAQLKNIQTYLESK